MLSTNDLELCARTVAALGRDQSEDVRACLAWVLRNRLEKAASHAPAPAIPGTCETVLREALGKRAPRAEVIAIPDAELCRIRATTNLVWAGDAKDQTGGAIACHRHDASPEWAKNLTPTALLGAFLFFR